MVITVDHYGNLGTNLESKLAEGAADLHARIAGHEIHGLSKTFGSRDPGELVMLIDSDGYLTVAVVNGDAARELGVDIGETVELVAQA